MGRGRRPAHRRRFAVTKTTPVRGVPANPPVERASTLLMPSAEDVYAAEGPATYGRHGHTVHRVLEDALSRLDGGASTVLFPSGLAACAGALFGLCSTGDHVLVTDSLYGPTMRAALKTASRFGLTAERYDPRIGPGIADLIRPQTRVIYVESPGSLTFEIQDIPAIAAAAKARGVLTVADATWASGVAQQPLALGADVVVNACTKFVSGGSDVFLGAAIAADRAIGARIADYKKETGQSVSPDDAYLALRGLRSIYARYRAQAASALDLATWLGERPEVAQVLHPGLTNHPDHALWARDFADLPEGGGSVFSVILHQADTTRINAFLNALSVFGLGFSYGGFESLAIHCDPQLKRTAPPWRAAGALVRFAVGLEPLETLKSDLEQALPALAS